MSLSRQLHLYLGAFFAPLITFLIFVGAVQTFHLGAGPLEFRRPGWLRTAARLEGRQPATEMELLGLEPDRHAAIWVQRLDGSQKSFAWLAGLIAGVLVAPGLFALFTSFRRADDWLMFGALIVLGMLLPVGLSFL